MELHHAHNPPELIERYERAGFQLPNRMEDTATFDADSWYHTGDIGVVDAVGYFTVTECTADPIPRGGEDISALEVEDLLIVLPGVAEAVAVAAADSRLGEQVAVVWRVHAGAVPPRLENLRAHFPEAAVAEKKWPVRIYIVTDFPRTTGGKVQKFLVRRRLRDKRTRRAIPQS